MKRMGMKVANTDWSDFLFVIDGKVLDEFSQYKYFKKINEN
jgi:hypothetical protein